MPQKSQEAISAFIEKSLKRAQKLEESDLYAYACKIYEQILQVNPTSIPIVIKYSSCLCELQDVSKASKMLERTLRSNPSSIETYQHYIKILNKHQQFEDVKRLIKRAQNINEECRKSPKLCASYAQACHRSQTFNDGVAMLKWYESMYKDLTLSTENILLWRVYLCYQIGQYKQAVQYSDIILKLPNLKEDDIWYYRFQKCKYCALLGDYKTTMKLADLILAQSNRDKSKLKVYAIKAYCLLQTDQSKAGSSVLELALKYNPNDFMLQLKWSLFNLMVLRSQTEIVVAFQKLKQNHLKERVKYVVKKMSECSKTDFDNNLFSEHYNWYSELIDYKQNLESLLQFLEKPSTVTLIEQVINFAELLFLSLMQGYQDCTKTNAKLLQITRHTKQICRLNQEKEATQNVEK